MHKFYWHNQQHYGSRSTSNSDVTNSNSSVVPEVPARRDQTAVRVRVKSERPEEEVLPEVKKVPTGSHKVLLRLRKANQSQGNQNNRPKSVSDASDLGAKESSSSSPSVPTSSCHHYVYPQYNKTWTERTLVKALAHDGDNVDAGQHDYENVYSDTRQSRSSSTTASKSALSRSKSCERPRIASRLKKSQAVISRISTNFSDRVWAKLTTSSSNNNNSGTKGQRKEVNNRMCRSVTGWDNFDSLLISSRCDKDQEVFDDAETFPQSQDSSNAGHRSLIVSQTNDKSSDGLSCNSLTETPTSSTDQTSLSNRMRGFKKKISRLRSRSAERISQKSLLFGKSPTTFFGHELDGDECPVGHHNPGHILPTPPPPLRSQTTTPVTSTPIVQGAFIATAVAKVDCTPSPYDKEALRFKKGDVIDVISMNPSGLWRGHCQGRVGSFKFINVELVPFSKTERKSTSSTSSAFGESRRNQIRRRRRSFLKSLDNTYDQVKTVPKSVEELLRNVGLEEYLSVFVLNGYESLEAFEALDNDELDYLGVTDPSHRAKILDAAEVLKERSSSEDESVLQDPENRTRIRDESISFRRLSFPRDSGCFTTSNDDNQVPRRCSPSTSERSSQSGLSSLPESGISCFENKSGRRRDLSNSSGSNEGSDEDYRKQ